MIAETRSSFSDDVFASVDVVFVLNDDDVAIKISFDWITYQPMKSLKENFKMEEVFVSIQPSERPYLIFLQSYSVTYTPLSLKKVTIDVLIDIIFFMMLWGQGGEIDANKPRTFLHVSSEPVLCR